MKVPYSWMILSCMMLAFTSPAAAQTIYDNTRALKGLSTSNIYFDVSLNEAQKLAFRMDLVQRTIQQIQEAGLSVSVVIGFRGGASRFITRDDHYVLEDDLSSKKKIQEWVKVFTAQGVMIEQCSIAAELYDIKPDDFLPEITIVKNGYVSLIGYQSQGYAVVPMD